MASKAAAAAEGVVSKGTSFIMTAMRICAPSLCAAGPSVCSKSAHFFLTDQIGHVRFSLRHLIDRLDRQAHSAKGVGCARRAVQFVAQTHQFAPKTQPGTLTKSLTLINPPRSWVDGFRRPAAPWQKYGQKRRHGPSLRPCGAAFPAPAPFGSQGFF